MMKRDPLKVIGVTLLVGLGLYLLLWAFAWFTIAYPIRYESSALVFDPTMWAEAGCMNRFFNRTRHRMIEDLKPQLMGKTKKEVVELLGEPDEYGQYCVGGEPVLFPIDTEWLEPIYGADGRVETIDFYYN